LKAKLSRTIIATAIILLLSYTLPYCLAENYSISYQLLNHPDGASQYELNVVVPESLYEYYNGRSHKLTSNDDFPKFVTPFALKPLADSLWEIYGDDEDFANGVLMIVHQIPYEETLPAKYPIETMVENKGDCDLFSYIAASIMKAGGLHVILLYYEEEAHMNIGVHLSQAPQDARGRVYSVTYNSVTYYVAECTGTSWEDGWRVGECPDDLRRTSAQVITLENSETVAPGQVSASYATQEPTALSLAISSTNVIQGTALTLGGQLTPALSNKNVTIYVKVNTSPWVLLGTVETGSDGHFEYFWKANTAGICSIRASWSGDDLYAGAISPIQTVTVISNFFILLLSIALIVTCIGVIAFLISRQSSQGVPEPQEPQPPAIPS